MKKLFHKAITVLGGLTLIGATLSGALAASYSSLTGSNTAVVVGASALASDSTAAATVVADLGVGTGSVVVEGGDSFKLETSYKKFNMGDDFSNVIATLNEDHMEGFLAEGTYRDKDNVEMDYSQSITFPTTGPALQYFSDRNYNDKEETLGFNIAKDAEILKYKLDLEGELNEAVGVDIPLLGGTYYVSKVNTTGTHTIELFDASSVVEVEEGQTTTITVGEKTYEVSVSHISTGKARVTVNGKSLGNMNKDETQKLSDDSHLLLKEVYVSSKESIPSSVEVTIGSGSIKLTNGAAVRIADKDVKGLKATTVNDASGVIEIEWTATETKGTFLTEEDNELIMPGFQSLKLVYGGVESSDLEETAVVPGEELVLSLELKDGSIDLPILSYDSSRVGYGVIVGNDDGNVFLTPESSGTYGGKVIVFDVAYTGNGSSYTEVRESMEDNMIIVSSARTSGEEYRSQVYKVDEVNLDDAELTLSSLVDGSTFTLKDGREVTRGNVKFEYTNGTARTGTSNDGTPSTLSISPTVSGTYTVVHDKIYTANGLTVNLDFTKLVGAADKATFNSLGNLSHFTLLEPDYEGKLSDEGFKLNVKVNSDDDLEVDGYALVTAAETKVKTKDVTTGYLNTRMASRFEFDEADSNKFSIFVGNEEAIADVSIASGSARVTTSTGAVPLKDSEVSGVDKNLVVVGGSAINTVAAELLGGSYRGTEFTEHTGVGEGQFMIKAFNRGGKTALLVAGYEAADTTRAVSYLLENAKSISLTDGEGKVYSTATATVVA